DARHTEEPEQGLHQNLLLRVSGPDKPGSRKGHAAVHRKLGWSIWGLFPGVLIGLGDLRGFPALGLDMRLAGRSLMAEVLTDLLLMFAFLPLLSRLTREKGYRKPHQTGRPP